MMKNFFWRLNAEPILFNVRISRNRGTVFYEETRSSDKWYRNLRENLYQYRYILVQITTLLKGQSHEKVGEMRVEGDSLGPN
jgi:hypothetical protein